MVCRIGTSSQDPQEIRRDCINQNSEKQKATLEVTSREEEPVGNEVKGLDLTAPATLAKSGYERDVEW